MPTLWCNGPVFVVLLAALLDRLIGDPWGWIHPVQVMGWGIQGYTRWALKGLTTPRGQRLAGIILGLGFPLLCAALCWLWVEWLWRRSPSLGVLTAVILMASCWAGRSLRMAAEDVLAPLQQADLPIARERLSLYVGRDTHNLSKAEILRAVLETVSENATDGALGPLFYGLVGSAIAPAGGVALAVGYKALSTLDSMVGYREKPYTYLGWGSAILEDAATWLPCRLTVLTIAALSGHPRRVIQLCRRDAPADPSPNAGWSECAYAAALGVQLGGVNHYRGQIKQKPLLAEAQQPITEATVRRALALTRWSLLLWLLLGAIGLSLRYHLHCE